LETPDRTVTTRQLGITLDDVQWQVLVRYVDLLERWNARFNLISRRDVDRLWSRHVLDSLSILPVLSTLPCRGERCRVLDVGTGAGFPGVPLAVADPGRDWLLVDRNARKIRFLELVVSELELSNVTVRAVDLGGRPPDGLVAWADVIVSRAMAAPGALVARTGAMLVDGGTFLLMTGAGGDPENATADGVAPEVDLPGGFRITGVRSLRIPGLDRVHEVTIIQSDANGQAERQD